MGGWAGRARAVRGVLVGSVPWWRGKLVGRAGCRYHQNPNPSRGAGEGGCAVRTRVCRLLRSGCGRLAGPEPLCVFRPVVASHVGRQARGQTHAAACLEHLPHTCRNDIRAIYRARQCARHTWREGRPMRLRQGAAAPHGRPRGDVPQLPLLLRQALHGGWCCSRVAVICAPCTADPARAVGGCPQTLWHV